MPSFEYVWVFSDYELKDKEFYQCVEEKAHADLGLEIIQYLAENQKPHTIHYLPVVEMPWRLDTDYIYRQWEVVINEI